MATVNMMKMYLNYSLFIRSPALVVLPYLWQYPPGMSTEEPAFAVSLGPIFLDSPVSYIAHRA
jgi:hypothetical protein